MQNKPAVPTGPAFEVPCSQSVCGSSPARSMVTLSCTVSVSYLPIISLGMHSQSYLLTLAPLINSIIGPGRWWDDARETLSRTRIPLPGLGSVRKQNPLWDISCGAGVPGDLQICITPTFFPTFFLEEEEISILFPIGSAKVGRKGSGQVLPAVPPPPPPPPGPDNAHSVCPAPCEAITTFSLT